MKIERNGVRERWRYVLNYSPFDITYKLCKFLPFKVVIYCMKEIQRASKVLHGVHFAMKIYPNEWVIISIIGILKGVLLFLERVLYELHLLTYIHTYLLTSSSVPL